MQPSDKIWHIYTLPTTILQNEEKLFGNITLMQPSMWHLRNQSLQLTVMQINSRRILREKLRHLRIRPKVSERITIVKFCNLRLSIIIFFYFPGRLITPHLEKKHLLKLFLGSKKDNTRRVDIALNFVCLHRSNAGPVSKYCLPTETTCLETDLWYYCWVTILC